MELFHICSITLYQRFEIKETPQQLATHGANEPLWWVRLRWWNCGTRLRSTGLQIYAWFFPQFVSRPDTTYRNAYDGDG